MDANLLVFGRPSPDPEPILLKAGVLTLEFHPGTGAIRYLELPDGTEAVRAVYPSLRRGNWSTITGVPEDLKIDSTETGFSISYGLTYEEVGYRAKVTIQGGAEEIVFAYEGEAGKEFETSRTGLCILHPANLADQPVEIRHPDGTRESGRFPDLVMPEWPYRDIVGVSSKLPGYKVDITMEGEIFEMEDQRNYGDASFKTYCRPQSRPFPYKIAAGEKVTQTVRIGTKPWGKKVEALDSMPEGEGQLLFLDEGGPIPLFGLLTDAATSMEAYVRAPADFFSLPVEDASDIDFPMELTFDLSEDAEARIESGLAKIAALSVPPDRVVVTPLSAAKHVPAIKEALGEVTVMLGSGNLVELNRSSLGKADADGFSVGWHPQGHLVDDRTLFENLEALPDIAATIGERTEGAVVMGPVRMGPSDDPRYSSLMYASWMVGALWATFMSDIDAIVLGSLGGPDGILSEEGPTPAYHVLRDVTEFSDGELLLGIGSPRRVAGFAIVREEEFRAIVANLTAKPIEVTVLAASPLDHFVKILDETTVEQATREAGVWREDIGEIYEPVEGLIQIKLGPYGVARIDAEVEDFEEEDDES